MAGVSERITRSMERGEFDRRWLFDDVRCMLLDDTFEFREQRSVAEIARWELSGGTYARRPVTRRSLTRFPGGTDYHAARVNFPALRVENGRRVGFAAIFVHDGFDHNSEVLCVCRITDPPEPCNADYTIVWDHNGVVSLRT